MIGSGYSLLFLTVFQSVVNAVILIAFFHPGAHFLLINRKDRVTFASHMIVIPEYALIQ